MTLHLAINYGGRDEIIRGIKKIIDSNSKNIKKKKHIKLLLSNVLIPLLTIYNEVIKRRIEIGNKSILFKVVFWRDNFDITQNSKWIKRQTLTVNLNSWLKIQYELNDKP